MKNKFILMPFVLVSLLGYSQVKNEMLPDRYYSILKETLPKHRMSAFKDSFYLLEGGHNKIPIIPWLTTTKLPIYDAYLEPSIAFAETGDSLQRFLRWDSDHPFYRVFLYRNDKVTSVIDFYSVLEYYRTRGKRKADFSYQMFRLYSLLMFEADVIFRIENLGEQLFYMKEGKFYAISGSSESYDMNRFIFKNYTLDYLRTCGR